MAQATTAATDRRAALVLLPAVVFLGVTTIAPPTLDMWFPAPNRA